MCHASSLHDPDAEQFSYGWLMVQLKTPGSCFLCYYVNGNEVLILLLICSNHLSGLIHCFKFLNATSSTIIINNWVFTLDIENQNRYPKIPSMYPAAAEFWMDVSLPQAWP